MEPYPRCPVHNCRLSWSDGDEKFPETIGWYCPRDEDGIEHFTPEGEPA